MAAGDHAKRDKVAHRYEEKAPSDICLEGQLDKRTGDPAGHGGYKYPRPTRRPPWRRFQRGMMTRWRQGMVLKPASQISAHR